MTIENRPPQVFHEGHYFSMYNRQILLGTRYHFFCLIRVVGPDRFHQSTTLSVDLILQDPNLAGFLNTKTCAMKFSC